MQNGSFLRWRWVALLTVVAFKALRSLPFIAAILFATVSFAEDAFPRDARLSELAQHGKPETQYSIGYRYETGHGAPKDIQEAMNWYRLAALQGYGPAMTSVGAFYAQGVGVKKDLVQAADWYQKAANVNDRDGLFNLANAYKAGDGVEASYTKYLALLQRSGDMGHAYAIYSLALYYLGRDDFDLESHSLNFSLAYCYLRIAKAVRSPEAEAILSEDQFWNRALSAEQQREADNRASQWTDGRELPQSVNLQTLVPFVSAVGADGLRLVGPIKAGAAQSLEKNLTPNIRKIYVNSFGGDVGEGVAIGDVIKNKDVTVIVDGACLSACANYIFLISSHRIIKENSLVCFHGGAPKDRSAYTLVQKRNTPDLSEAVIDEQWKSFRPIAEAEKKLIEAKHLPAWLFEPELRAGIPNFLAEESGKTIEDLVSDKVPMWCPQSVAYRRMDITIQQAWYPEDVRHVVSLGSALNSNLLATPISERLGER